METLYLDTNIIIARYKPGDPLHELSEKLVNDKSFKLFISPVTLFELYAVISRISPYLLLPNELNHTSLATLIHFIIKDCNLNFKSRTLLTSINFKGFKATLPFEYLMSSFLAEKLRLRALDLLHISYAAMLRDEVKLFITGDEEILEKKEAIKEFTEVEVRHPKEMY